MAGIPNINLASVFKAENTATVPVSLTPHMVIEPLEIGKTQEQEVQHYLDKFDTDK